ncbi:hypothetical protein ACIQYS_09700 [Psychrobacillus sp. NPDC096426]|uniref:hypothetical protein n=1 Tax=Psychrobacillus sp. NPDC096426 TaxID=3364491 RepID=UPI003805C19C
MEGNKIQDLMLAMIQNKVSIKDSIEGAADLMNLDSEVFSDLLKLYAQNPNMSAEELSKAYELIKSK